MGRTATTRATTHTITVCTSRRHAGGHRRPGPDLIAGLRAAPDAAGGAVAREFAVAGAACMAGGDRPCTVACAADAKATYLFGDVGPDADVPDRVLFARRYRASEDGWCSSTTRPGRMRRSTLARVPAAAGAVR